MTPAARGSTHAAEGGGATADTVAAGPRVLPMGESALLVELTDAAATLALYEAVRASAPPWLIDLVPAARTVLLTFDRTRTTRAGAAAWIAAIAPDAAAPPRSHASPRATAAPGTDGPAIAGGSPDTTAGTGRRAPLEVVVRYDGVDLEEVAGLLGLTVEEVIAAHTGELWTSAFIGFAPGFAYLRGERGLLDVPRRAAPRAAVPAGSVALAAGYCGVYPRESPGGWHLIGRTTAVLWNAESPQPALLPPGTRVRFIREA